MVFCWFSSLNYLWAPAVRWQREWGGREGGRIDTKTSAVMALRCYSATAGQFARASRSIASCHQNLQHQAPSPAALCWPVTVRAHSTPQRASLWDLSEWTNSTKECRNATLWWRENGRFLKLEESFMLPLRSRRIGYPRAATFLNAVL